MVPCLERESFCGGRAEAALKGGLFSGTGAAETAWWMLRELANLLLWPVIGKIIHRTLVFFGFSASFSEKTTFFKSVFFEKPEIL